MNAYREKAEASEMEETTTMTFEAKITKIQTQKDLFTNKKVIHVALSGDAFYAAFDIPFTTERLVKLSEKLDKKVPLTLTFPAEMLP